MDTKSPATPRIGDRVLTDADTHTWYRDPITGSYGIVPRPPFA